MSSPFHHPITQQHARSSVAPLFTPTTSSSSTVHSPPSASHRCSVPSCSAWTTSPALSAAFLSLATLCFPPAGSESSFSSKSNCYLCRVHRATLSHFRQRVVSHATDSTQLWTDDPHSSPVRGGDAERDEEDEGRPEPTVESALVSGSSTPLRYSSFTDATAVDAADGESEKRSLSLAARTALAGGWLLVISFVALTAAWGIVAQIRG